MPKYLETLLQIYRRFVPRRLSSEGRAILDEYRRQLLPITDPQADPFEKALVLTRIYMKTTYMYDFGERSKQAWAPPFAWVPWQLLDEVIRPKDYNNGSEFFNRPIVPPIPQEILTQAYRWNILNEAREKHSPDECLRLESLLDEFQTNLQPQYQPSASEKRVVEQMEQDGAYVDLHRDWKYVSFSQQCSNVDQLMPLLQELPSLTSIKFDRCHVTDAGLATLVNQSKLAKVECESLNYVSSNGYEFLEKLPSLTKFICRHENAQIGEGICRSVGRCPTLKELSCDYTPLTETALKALEPLVDLQILSMSRCGITSLAFLCQMRHLQKLSLSDNPVQDESLQYLCCQSTLGELSLSNSGITDASGPEFARLQALEDLYLIDTSITSKILPYLSSLPQLRKLAIWNTALTPDCVEVLRTMTQLHTLTIPQDLLDEAAWNSLKEALPETHLSELM
jgi:hypothetical protein